MGRWLVHWILAAFGFAIFYEAIHGFMMVLNVMSGGCLAWRFYGLCNVL